MYKSPEVGLRREGEYLSLIELIYQAAVDASCWLPVLSRLARMLQCEQVVILPNDSNAIVADAFVPVTMAPKDSDFHTRFPKSTGALGELCNASFPAGSIRYAHRSWCESRFDRGEMGSRYALRQRSFCRFSLKVPLFHSPEIFLVGVRRNEDGHFTNDDGAVLKTLMPHLQRAFRLHLERERSRSSERELKAVLDSFDRAVFGLNRDGMVILSNRQADAIAAKADGLKLIQGRLAAGSSLNDSYLKSQIAKSTGTGAEGSRSRSVAFHLSRQSENLPLQLTITPFTSVLPNSGAQLAVLVFVNDPAQRPQSCSALLRQLYGLSPTECRLADLLHEGLEVREAANRLKTTLGTARFHLKRVLAKTGTRRQPELIRLMMALPGVLGNPTAIP